MRARSLRMIEQHWGPDWFDEIPADMKDPTWTRAADCSHQLLRLIAANAKQGLALEDARAKWAESMAQRRDERLRKERRMRCPRLPYILPGDVRFVNHLAEPDHRGRRTTELFFPHEPAEDELKVELVRPRTGRTPPPPSRPKRDRKRKRSPVGATEATRSASPPDEDGWYPSKNGLWMVKRVGKHLVRKPIEAVSTDETNAERENPPTKHGASQRIHELPPSTPPSGDDPPLGVCEGPALAAILRRLVRSLSDSNFSDETLAPMDMVPKCCGSCQPDASMLDGLVRDAIRIARSLEAVRSHQSSGREVRSSQVPGSNPPTPRFPRFRPRLLSPADDDGDVADVS